MILTGQDPTTIMAALERDGVVMLPPLLTANGISALQTAFGQALQHRSWNTWRGFEQNEKWRRLVEDVLLLSPGFTDIALHPLVLDVLDSYLGDTYQLTEARGWETVRTTRSFHGWHNDAWYDTALPNIPREVKLGFYLTDVETGHFCYARGTHNNHHRPNHWNDKQVTDMGCELVDMKGPAGSAFLFDTSGVHRQTSPVLDPRWAVMFNYHNPATPLQEVDITYGRYQPLKLDVSYIGGLNAHQQKVLGLKGERPTDWGPANAPKRRFAALHSVIDKTLAARLELEDAKVQLIRVKDGLARRLKRP